MSDLYTEEIVKKEKTMKDTVIRVLLIAGTAVAVLSLMVLGWLSIILIIAFAVADYFVLPTLELEYEYLYVNGEIDIDKIEAAITPKTKGVMIVHLYGRVAYNDKLGEICKKHNLKLMEDCAQSQGCAWKGV